MRRKSERNKSKGSPEKKVEKATRKSTRKRGGKRATSSSPEREDGEGKSSTEVVVVKSEENVNEVVGGQPATTRLKIKELKSIVEEESPSKPLISSSVSDVGNEKEKESLEGAASVWKVARADASPGEIQKLKLCRQRNPSEASDSSSSRKKSHKSYESGEGDGEEGDSSEEIIKSRRNRDFLKSGRTDDPDSSIPGVRDYKEEVSHCSDVLPRNTSSSSANLNFLLSDDGDKKNLDRLAENYDQARTSLEQNSTVQEIPNSDENTINNEPSSNGDDFQTPAAEREELKEKIEKDEEKEEEKKDDGRKAEENKEETPIDNKIVSSSGDDIKKDIKEQDIETKKNESSSEEEKYKPQSPESGELIKGQSNRPEVVRTPPRNLRRKHRSKYHESSDSDTPESEEESGEKKVEQDEKPAAIEEEKTAETNESRSPSSDDRLASSKDDEKEVKNSADREDRVNYSADEKTQDDGNASSRPTGYKPPKVNLKRSFSARFVETEETQKKDDSEKNGESEASIQVKENNGAAVAGDETEIKNLPRKRRWGTTTTTVTAEVVPAFTVSTDSLKVLVPGAKPLSITEVRLSKDDDEEKSKRKEREKRYSVGEDNGEKKIRDEGAAVKNDGSKKGELKHDNHIGAKRKISILKEIPRVKSPSPSSDKATNILLIKNLVRPFTLNQIKELLSRTGTIVENGFWIDGIKSKCYVVYSNEDQAFETRQALHGISWPVSNPKRLQVEYATKEDMDLARELCKDQPVQRKTEPLIGSDNWQQVWARDDKQNVAVKVTTVREWDLGKEDGDQVKEKEREKKDLEKKRRQRSRSPPIEPHLPPPARKFKKKEDEPPPAKLLDDLFKKTKAIPCIYWLPLTNEQIVVKEEMRRQHMAEHARRLEEMKRAERSRDPGSRRRRSPRK